MECELWPRLYALVSEIGTVMRRQGARYSDAVIVLVFFWACLHDRPQCWACQPRNWSSTRDKPLKIPSHSTVSRRLRTPSVLRFLEVLESRLRNTRDAELVKIIDGKPLTVGQCSKDRDAKVGRVVGGFAKGYKLHAIWGSRDVPEAWTIRSLNENESPVARQLMLQLAGEGYLLGDRQYDVIALYDAALANGHQLVVPRNRRKAEHPHTLTQHESRQHAMDMLERPFGKQLYKRRNEIERCFGSATCFGGGLGPLPAWVRHLPRVDRWVRGKLIINGLRIQQRLTA